MINEFCSLRKRTIYNELDTCNTEKSKLTSCDIKCKTRGILIMATNCGIVVSFREMYGAESLTQVALFYLDTLDHWQGKLSTQAYK